MYSKYEKHRDLIMEDIFASLARLPTSKKSMRTYKYVQYTHYKYVQYKRYKYIQYTHYKYVQDKHYKYLQYAHYKYVQDKHYKYVRTYSTHTTSTYVQYTHYKYIQYTLCVHTYMHAVRVYWVVMLFTNELFSSLHARKGPIC